MIPNWSQKQAQMTWKNQIILKLDYNSPSDPIVRLKKNCMDCMDIGCYIKKFAEEKSYGGVCHYMQDTAMVS